MKNAYRGLLTPLMVLILATPALGADWRRLTTEEARELYSGNVLSFMARGKQLRISYASVPGCGVQSWGGVRRLDFKEDGFYDVYRYNGDTTLQQSVETDDAGNYRWPDDDNLAIEVAPLEGRKLAKADKKVAKRFPECAPST